MDAPEDFVAFVARHEAEVRRAVEDLTGSASLVDRLRTEVFASVAARWNRLRPDSRWSRLLRNSDSRWSRVLRDPGSRWPAPLRRVDDAAGAHLRRVLARASGSWRDDLPEDSDLRWEVLGPDSGGRFSSAVPAPAPRAPAAVAQDAWDRGMRASARRNLTVRAGAALALLLLVLLPRAGQSPYVPATPDRPPGPRLPDTVPANVSLLILSGGFDRLPAVDTRLPEQATAAAEHAAPLSTSPLPSAVAVGRDGLGPLILISTDGSTRQVPAAELGDTQFLTTSLSPDGQRVALVSSTTLVVVDVPTGAVRTVRAPVDAQPAQPRMIWRTPRTVMVPGTVGATVIDVDTGAQTYDTSVSVLHVIAAQGPARDAYLTELVPRVDDETSARIRVRRSPPAGPVAGGPTPSTVAADLLPISAPVWMGRWNGQGWGNGSYFIRPCDAQALLLPADVGTAQDPLCVVDRRGLAVRTLTTVEQGVTMEALGWIDPERVLIRVNRDRTTWLLAWGPADDTLALASRLDGRLRVAVADLFVR